MKNYDYDVLVTGSGIAGFAASVTHAYPTYARALVGRASQLSSLDRMENNFLVKQVVRFLLGYDTKLGLARM